MATREEIALNFDVPILQYCELVKEAWDITKEDERKAKDKKERDEVFRDRLNIVSKFQSKIEKGAGELIDHCLPLISQNKDMMLKDFYEEMHGTKFDYGREQENPWAKCFNLFLYHYDKMLFYEENERQRRCFYRYNGQSVLCDKIVNGQVVEKVEASPITHNYPAVAYCQYRKTYEYKLCHKLCDFISTKCRMGQWAKGLLASLLLTVCLYIALENEQDKLIIFLDIFRDKSNQTPQTTAPAPQGKSKAKKKTKQPREVFTERAKLYFSKAIEKEYMQEVDEEEGSGRKYEWTYYGGTVALVYFLIRVYEPESPPYKQLAPLFGLKDLTTHRSNLVNTDWYHDELIRVGKLPEEKDRNGRPRKLKNPPDWLWELKVLFG